MTVLLGADGKPASENPSAAATRPATQPVTQPPRILATRPAVDGDLRVGEGEFTIISLPDTQIYSQRFPAIFLSQTQWIKDKARDLNVLCVLHEGDITNRCSEKEWEVADKALGILDGAAPYCIVPGNHDLAQGQSTAERYSLFDRFMPRSRVHDRPWFVGSPDASIRNACYKFEAGGMKLLVVCLEFGAPDTAIAWANDMIGKHADHRVIILTHCYMNHDDTRVGPGDRHNPHDYKTLGSGLNDGEDLWEKLVRKHANIFLVISGHILGDGTGRLSSRGDHGNVVHQVLANYQMNREGGAGMLRILRFSPRNNKIYIQTYSPWQNAFATEDDQHFELDYAMSH